MVRTALAAGDLELAAQLADGLEPLFPLREHALCAARARLAEPPATTPRPPSSTPRRPSAGASSATSASAPTPLLGQGRCLAALGRPEAEQPLRETRQLFASMGYQPALAETDALLGESTAAAV